MVPSILRLLSVLLLTAPLPLPKVVVPNFPELTITTRQTDGDRYSSLQNALPQGSPATQRIRYAERGHFRDGVTITRCDEKFRLDLNNKEKAYASFPIEDWTTRIKRAHPTPPEEMTGANVR
jgi:hypothetical protein